ncbi:pilus assembly protein CpaF [Thermoanaerobacter thermohydrosulfuricus]|uniref:Pilus assembly protein CpaF n=1 Tax=Thermoanaerobacter thermohydrosulfuricus TaxID=1516 RepID=A0A1G7ISR2_THETY|nr:ATPase, T2SS/T4P/T4SS family [Thermoanaerobacter thermohydrosulfuricus]SDF15711.1 pilus assembly protein CpaF [Thermoanaerobacter thermohydrosulfuricus]
MGLVDRISQIRGETRVQVDEALLKYVRSNVLDAYDNIAGDTEKMRELCRMYTDKYFSENYTFIPDDRIYELVYDTLFGLGPIEKHLKNPNVTDIYVLGTNITYIENGIKKKDPEGFISAEETRRVIDKIAALTHQTINTQQPHLDAELYDGSRALLVIPPESTVPVITIRKHTSRAKTLYELKSGLVNLTDEMIEYFKDAVKSRKNIIAVGQTGAGKTTFLNALTYFIQPAHVVAVLEDTREMQLPLDNVYYFKIRKGTDEVKPITWADILNNCLRANPDRIILTEIRTPEAAYEFLDTLNSGHRGSMTTIHASSVLLALQKLEMKVKEYKNMDDLVLRKLITDTVDILVFLDILENERGDIVGRVIREIAELNGLNPDGSYSLKYVYRYR